MSVPPGIYFSGAFTIIAWINIQKSVQYQRIIDFGNGVGYDEILWCMGPNTNNLISSIVFSGGEKGIQLASNNSLSLLTWYHVAYTLDSFGFGIFYLNGQQIYSVQQLVINSVLRSNNFIND